MNNALSVEAARAVAARKDVVNAMSEDQRIVAMFRSLFQRRPSTAEIRMAQEFVTKQKMQAASSASSVPGSEHMSEVSRHRLAYQPALPGVLRGEPAPAAAAAAASATRATVQ